MACHRFVWKEGNILRVLEIDTEEVPFKAEFVEIIDRGCSYEVQHIEGEVAKIQDNGREIEVVIKDKIKLVVQKEWIVYDNLNMCALDLLAYTKTVLNRYRKLFYRAKEVEKGGEEHAK